MSGLEVLGIVASAAQLVAYVITVSSKLNEVRCKIRHTPKRLEQYNRQFKVQGAYCYRTAYGQNPPIQTKELDGCLATIVARTGEIKEILTKFEQSSRSRRRWNIINGDLLRQLDECFKDVRNTMENVVVLIVSQNAHDQKELEELMIGVATATRQTTTTTTPLSCPTDSNDTTAECTKMKAGSYLFKGLTMKDNVTVSRGNVSSPYGTIPSMAGHVFINFVVSGNKVLHIGNTGCSEGHIFKDGVIEKNEVTMLGDYADLEQKFQHISLQQGSA
ncbi:hypothetical protein GGR58DRAFT_26286 [Xylaria digitata]|nr:hypothetical protein GGR58DRAFT_26286 [Xylaria digitata]